MQEDNKKRKKLSKSKTFLMTLKIELIIQQT